MIALVTLIDDPRNSTPAIIASLQSLERQIAAHINREDDVLSGLDQTELNHHWMKSWKVAANDLVQLRQQWKDFVQTWNEGGIDEHRDEFAAAATDMLQSLSARVQFETATFYTAALQAGVVTLR